MIARQTLGLLIPAYNATRFLPRLLKSARQQTIPFDEIWVYDDCSTDGTAAVADQLGARVVYGNVNRGCTFAKSVLVGHTTCDWIHFHDADDLLLPKFVATARSWMPQDDVDVVAFGCEERWEDTRELISVSSPDDRLLGSDPVGYNIRYKINAISGIYRRNAFVAAGGFDLDPDVLYNEDCACHCKLARAGLRFRGDTTVTVVNLRQPSSMWTANAAKCIRAEYCVMRKVAEGHDAKRHMPAITERLWTIVGSAASQLDWRTADEAASFALGLAGSPAASSGVIFKALCLLSPYFAIRVREWLIRALRSRLRHGYPGWRAPINLI
jgi:glycosyltransferase involved in cell wall biosynthesis